MKCDEETDTSDYNHKLSQRGSLSIKIEKNFSIFWWITFTIIHYNFQLL